MTNIVPPKHIPAESWGLRSALNGGTCLPPEEQEARLAMIAQQSRNLQVMRQIQSLQVSMLKSQVEMMIKQAVLINLIAVGMAVAVLAVVLLFL